MATKERPVLDSATAHAVLAPESYASWDSLLDTFDPRGSDTNASIIAHVNVLERMSGPSGKEPPTPAGAWPSDTYFTNEWELFVNDEALHEPEQVDCRGRRGARLGVIETDTTGPR